MTKFHHSDKPTSNIQRRYLTSMHLLLVCAALLGVVGCASIGRPQGGAKDEVPPVFVSSNPAPQALKVDRQRIDLYFNENVQLQDAFNKVIVSPAQSTAPQVSANGKHVTVHLRDTLIPNTTYTIDFGDAIKDLNEGNILDGFTTSFSTGDSIDTLRISGMVLEARTLEPAQGMLVGVYSNLADSAITTLPLERISRTNQLGQFTIYNLKAGDYRIYALNDINRDYKWDRSEDVAFYDVTLSPKVESIEVVDTLRGWGGSDSLRTRQGTAFYPNDVLLTWFNEGYASQYLKDYKRPDRRTITLNMATKADSLPEITIVTEGAEKGRNANEWSLLQKNLTFDSLEYWITDTAVLAIDSLMLSVKYQRTDTSNMLSWRTDTLKFFFKDPKTKEKKKNEEADTVPAPKVFMQFQAVTSQSQEIYMPLIYKADTPIDTILPEGVKLQQQVDTLWVDVPDIEMVIDTLSPFLRRKVYHKWDEGQKYRLMIDSASIFNVYGLHNNAFKHEFTVKKLDEYSNLTFNVQGLDSLPAVLEIVDKSDNVIASASVINGKAVLKYLKPGIVYARLFIDKNGNGKWDTGNLLSQLQPEDVYYYHKKLNLRKNWDVTQDWNIEELTVDMQKPWDIKKNKPKLKQGEKAPTYDDEEEDEEDGGYGYGGYGTTNSNGRGNQGRGNQGFGGMGGMGGMGGFGNSLRR